MIASEINNDNDNRDHPKEDDDGDEQPPRLDETSVDLSPLIAVTPVIRIREFDSQLAKSLWIFNNKFVFKFLRRFLTDFRLKKGGV